MKRDQNRTSDRVSRREFASAGLSASAGHRTGQFWDSAGGLHARRSRRLVVTARQARPPGAPPVAPVPPLCATALHSTVWSRSLEPRFAMESADTSVSRARPTSEREPGTRDVVERSRRRPRACGAGSERRGAQERGRGRVRAGAKVRDSISEEMDTKRSSSLTSAGEANTFRAPSRALYWQA
jgi:hypothetical protein